MKLTTVFCIICLIAGLAGGFFVAENNLLSTDGYTQNKEISLCVYQQTFAMDAVQKTLQKQLSEKHILEIKKLNTSFELSESPSILGTKLYREIKNGSICESSFDAVVKNSENQKEFKMQLNTRYQLARAAFPEDYIYFFMGKEDINETVDSINNEIYKQKNIAKQEKMKENSQTVKEEKISEAQKWMQISREQQKKVIVSVLNNSEYTDIVANCVSVVAKEAIQKKQFIDSIKPLVLFCNNDGYPREEFFIEEYSKNSVVFDKKYTNKLLKLSGPITEISTNGVLQISSSKFSFDGYIECVVKDKEQILNLQTGQNIKVEGIYEPDSSYKHKLKECVIIEEQGTKTP